MKTPAAPARLSFEQLGWEMQTLREWVLHSSRLSLSRELVFVTPGRAFRFLTAASLWSHGRRQWPLFTLERARVWLTIRNLEEGITERDLELARQLECLYRHCEQGPRARARPSPTTSADPALAGGDAQAGLDSLVERTVTAARRLIAELRQTSPTGAPAHRRVPEPREPEGTAK